MVKDITSVEAAAVQIVTFIIRHQPKRVNVCGHRDDATAGMPNFEAAVGLVLMRAFAMLVERKMKK
jgi:hypothetical protein